MNGIRLVIVSLMIIYISIITIMLVCMEGSKKERGLFILGSAILIAIMLVDSIMLR